MAGDVKEMTHAWTIYRLDDDGNEADEAYAEIGRPQDWGDSVRWLHKVYTLEAEINGVKYRNEVHCWAEKPLSEGEHLEMFAPFVVLLTEPWTPRELCGKTHLDTEDFWEAAWGPQPPYYDLQPDEDDDYWAD